MIHIWQLTLIAHSYILSLSLYANISKYIGIFPFSHIEGKILCILIWVLILQLVYPGSQG